MNTPHPTHTRGSTPPSVPVPVSVRERGGGAISVPVAVLLLALLAVVGLAVDGAHTAQQIATADAVAEEAARAGAQAVDLAAAQHGQAHLDPAAARAAAQRYLDAAHTAGTTTITTGTVTVTGDQIRVEVTLTAPTLLLGLVGVDTVTTTGAAQAQLVATDPGGDG
jgi:Flp pilus assembly protein TadG